MKNLSVSKSVAGWLWLATAVLAIIAVLVYNSVRSLDQVNQATSRTHRVLGELNKTLSSLKDAETGQRGYLLTGQATFLEPYQTASADVLHDLRQIHSLTVDNSEQQKRLEALQPLVIAKLDFVQHTITLHRQGKVEAARRMVSSTRGKRIMDDIRRRIRVMEQVESTLLAQQQARAHSGLRQTTLAASSGLLFSLALLVLVYNIVRRETARRNRDEAALQRAGDELELRVRERTAEFRASEERFRLMVESVRDYAILMLDAGGVIVSWNSGAEHIKGYTAEEIIGQHFSHFYTPEDIASNKPERELETATVEGRYDEEGWRVRKDGSRFWASVVITAMRDEAGQLRGFAKVTRDLTERHRAEQERAEAQRRLKFLSEASEALASSLDYETTLNRVANLAVPHMADWCAVYLLREDSVVKRVALAHADPTKIAWAEELERRYPSDPDATVGVPQVIRTGQAELYPEISDAMLAGTTRDAEHLQLLREIGFKSAMVVPLAARGHVLGAITFVACNSERHFKQVDLDLATDLTRRAALAVDNAYLYHESRQLNQELEKRVAERTAQLENAIQAAELAREDAERANDAKSEFLSRTSHELRTPLNAILGFAQLMEMDELEEGHREGIKQILKGGRHLLELVNEILDIAAIDAGRMALSAEPVQLSQLVQETMTLVQPLADERGIRFENALGGGFVLADQQRLKQVLLNLLSNAVKYNRDSGLVRLASGTAAVPGRVRFEVTDTGPGIPPVGLEKLFVPFERLNAGEKGVEGTGIGLAISQRLVQVMDGEIGVYSVEGEGSTFWVELPGAQDPMQAVERRASVRPVVELTPSRNDTVPETADSTILYIEDNLSNLNLIEHILSRRKNVRLLSAMQGRRGLELAREHRPDLVLLDLHLPDLTGDEVLHHLLAEDQTRDIPVVMLSADATPRQSQRLLDAGAKAYLTKPLNVKQFMSVLDANLPSAKEQETSI